MQEVMALIQDPEYDTAERMDDAKMKEATVKKKVTTNPTRTSREQFLKVYAKALKLGWTREQCAAELGIKPESVYARCLVEKAAGNNIRPLPVASRKVNEDEINALLAEVCVPTVSSRTTALTLTKNRRLLLKNR